MSRTILAAAVAASALYCSVAGPALAEDRHVVIVNATSYTIEKFYASNVGTDDWEEDILGQDVLLPGQDVTINIDDGTGHCRYDFKAVFEDGDEARKDAVNVCEIGTFTFNE